MQVFLNLVLNAIDAAGRDGHIDLAVTLLGRGLETTAQQEAVEVAVRDDGCGVAPENAGRLFQPYFTTKKHGTGLGLFVTRQLVADHGGTVDFESRPGEGAVFRVRLPLAAGVPPTPTLPRKGGGRKTGSLPCRGEWRKIDSLLPLRGRVGVGGSPSSKGTVRHGRGPRPPGRPGRLHPRRR